MRAHRTAMGIQAALLASGIAQRANADQGLADQFNALFGPRGIILPTNQFHLAHFTSTSQATLGLLVQQLAPGAADFPAVSTVPGLSFRYNSELQAFERSSGSLGPVYVERPQTVGRGKLDIGFSYLFQDFDELDGDSLDGLSFRLPHADCCGGPGTPGNPLFETDTADLIFDQFDLESHVLSLYATYGITDRWDVNVLVPIMFTSLEVNARAVLNNPTLVDCSQFPPGVPCDPTQMVHEFPGGTNVQQRSIDDDSTGVGDLLLRTKYHILSTNGFNLASGLSLRLPTGDEDDFQGLDDVVLTPYLALSQEWSRFDFHFQAGFDINADDTERSRARYGIGLTTQLVERLAFLIDIIGSSNLTEQDISVTVPVIVGSTEVGRQTITQGLRTDIVDLAIGFKAAFAPSVVGFASVFLPLNDDGLRSDAVPTAGLEVSF